MSNALPPSIPRHWSQETGGVLRPAVMAYVQGDSLTDEQIGALRAYLRQWIEAPTWRGFVVDDLRRTLDGLTSRRAIREWLDLADEAGIDPL